ncbi:MAG: hypothetical protein DHS20C14_05230 [Phycisphaeraceae bacterium]|nr:MAG: hypothetical protein DHS20C14_05230 [Phycisphaeraceae bacterium]
MRTTLMPLLVLMTLSAAAAGDTYTEQHKLTAPDGAADDYFSSLATDGTTVVVGAFGHDANGDESGAAYLYDVATGSLITKLLPADIETDDNFGFSVAMGSGYIAIGAPEYDLDPLVGIQSGVVYLFDSATGTQVTKIMPDDAMSGQFFGWSVAIHQDLLVVGAPFDDVIGPFMPSGSAYIFEIPSGDQVAKLTPTDGTLLDDFGAEVAVHAPWVIVGAPRDADDNGTNSGSAYIFDTAIGIQFAKLVPSDGAEFDGFGRSMAINQDVIAIGASGHDDGADNGGVVYMYDTATLPFPAPPSKVYPDDITEGHRFGNVALTDDLLLVGTSWDSEMGTEAGAAYLFDLATGTQITKLTAQDADPEDYFGGSVSIANDTIAVGASGDDNSVADSGSAYLFAMTAACAFADVNADGVLNVDDVEAFVIAFLASDPAADCDANGLFNVDDIECFVASFLAGCP